MRLEVYLLLVIALWAILGSYLVLTSGYEADETTHSLVGKFFVDFFKDWIRNPAFSFQKIYNYSVSYLMYYPKLSLQYPPVSQILFALGFSIFGSSLLVSRFVVLALSILAVVLVYFLVKNHFGNKKAGVIAGIFLISSPVFMKASVFAITDMGYLLFFTLVIYMTLELVKKPILKNKIFLSVSIALCVLSRFQAVLIFPVIIIFVLWQDRKKLVDVVQCVLLALLILSPYYYVQYKSGLLFIPLSANLGTEGNYQSVSFRTPSGIIYYAKEFFINQFPAIGIFLLGLTLVYFKKGKENWKLFFVWIFIVYAVMTLVSNKAPKYTINYLPAFVIPAALVLTDMLDKRNYSKIALVILAFVGLQMILIPYTETFRDVFTFPKNIQEVSKVAVSNSNGNIFIQSNYGSGGPFIFEMAKLEKFKNQIFRPCDNLNLTGNFEKFLSENRVDIIIANQTQESQGRKDLDALYTHISSSEDFERIYENQGAEIYRYKNFTSLRDGKICNFVCALGKITCSEFRLPADALK